MNLGVKTHLKEDGKRLSGGQKQRINIARNLYNLRQVNIFDDTLSALDEKTKKQVMENLLQIGKHTTMIFVSNSVEQIKKLDKIYVMEKRTSARCGNTRRAYTTKCIIPRISFL